MKTTTATTALSAYRASLQALGFFLSFSAVPALAQTPCTSGPILEGFGTGSLGSLGVPELRNQGAPLVGLPFALALDQGLPGAPGLVILSAGEAQLPLPGFLATAYVDLVAPNLLEAFQLDASGSADSLIALPALPAGLCGVQFTAQALVLDPLATGGLAFTPGFRIRIGAPASGLLFPGEHRLLPGSSAEVLAGDLDGNGLDDLVLLSSGAAPSEIYLASGEFEFTPAGTFQSPSFPSQGQLIDLDGDSDLDLCFIFNGTIFQQAAGVAVLLGDGAGGFSAAQSYSAGEWPVWIEAADFDLDGRLDLVVANQLVGTASVLYGLGGGAFGVPQTVALGVLVYGVAPGDMNGDGLPDLVASGTSLTGGALFVALNDGLGGFLPPAVTDTAKFPNNAPRLADLDGDGALDCLLSEGNFAALTVRLGDGLGGFGPPTFYFLGSSPDLIVLEDLDGDGHQDVVATSLDSLALEAVSVFKGIGDGTLVKTQSVPIGAALQGIALGHFGSDPHTDLLVRVNELGGGLRGYHGRSGGEFAAPVRLAKGGIPGATSTADFDGDGKLDLAVLYASEFGGFSLAGIQIQLSGQPPLAPPLTLLTLSGTTSGQTIAADFNGDGNADLALAAQGQLFTWIGDGQGGFAGPLVQPLPGEAIEALAVDMQGDGVLDLVVALSQPDALVVLRGLGTGAFQVHQSLPAPLLGSLELADLQNDGWLDAIETSYLLDEVRIRSGLPGGDLRESYLTLPKPDVWDAICLDIEGDGDLDLAVSSSPAAGGEVQILTNDGQGNLQSSQILSVGFLPYGLDSGDYDADGFPDLAAINLQFDSSNSGETIFLLRNDGSGGFVVSRSIGVGNISRFLESADLTGDGLPDFLVGHTDNKDVWLLPNLLLE